jgi:glycosyltransferase involved in cell wall biosynthesis
VAASSALGEDDREEIFGVTRAELSKAKRRPAPLALVEPAAKQQPLKILVASHSHPRITNGGGEIAAHQMFRELQAREDCRAWFLGCDRHALADKPGAVLAQPFSSDEFIYCASHFDWFKFANPDARFRAEFEQLIRELDPDVVHFHHYINFGVEVFQFVKNAAPNCRLILTLHEYLAICNYFGQMVTPAHKNLCDRAEPSRCHKCFREHSKQDFFLRNLYIRRFLDLVDIFVAPSQFLAERYIEWGLPKDKIRVLENLIPPPQTPRLERTLRTRPLRIGFFGQISVLKGIDVMFEAAAALEREGATNISFEIFGDYQGQPPEFQDAFLGRLAKAGSNIRYMGGYEQSSVDRLMQGVHAVLVPSIWWENSPVVIQEALRNRRPVICSDIGGMAEKVRDGIDGFHFSVGSSMALASLLRELAVDRTILSDLALQMSGRPAVESSIEAFLELYRGGEDTGKDAEFQNVRLSQ